jgi:exosortase
MKYGLPDATVDAINAVFSEVPAIESVVLYGSRAKGNFRPGSDIDLTIVGNGLTDDDLARIENQLDDLLLPYTFDLSLYRQLEPSPLIEHIRRVGVLFYARECQQPRRVAARSPICGSNIFMQTIPFPSYLRHIRWVALALTGAAAAWLFGVIPLVSPDKLQGVPGSLIYWLTRSWSAAEDMQHGWLIPLVSVYVLWSRRKELAEGAGAPDWRGVLAVAFGALLVWIGLKAEQARVHLIALAWLFWAVPFALWGRRVARLLVFPACFLLLAMPLGTVVTFFTVRLRLLAAGVAAGVLNGVGIEVQRMGTGLHSMAGEGFNLDVADPCSGLRSIFALTALTALYAFLTQKAIWQKWLLFLCSVPLAVVGNVVRIVAIAGVARIWGQKAATGFYHDYSGYVVFVVAILLMMEAGVLIARIRLGRSAAAATPSPSTDSPETPPAVASGAGKWPTRSLAMVFAVPLLVCLAGWLARNEPRPQVLPIDFIATALPVQVGPYAGDRPWFCHNPQCIRACEERDLLSQASPAERTNAAPVLTGAVVNGNAEPPNIQAMLAAPFPVRCRSCGGPMYAVSLGEKTLLPADTIVLKQDYLAPDGERIGVSLVISGASRDSIHKPENCLPAQGFALDRLDCIQLPLAGRAPLQANRVAFSRSVAEGQKTHYGLVYWFVGGKHETPWHHERMFWTTWERARYNRAVRWSYISISGEAPFDSEERLEKLRAFIQEWYPKVRR